MASGEPVARGVGLVGAREPEGPAQVPGARRGPGQGEPAAVDLVGAVRVDHHVAVAIVRTRSLGADLLVPAVLAAHGVWLDWEREVLVDAGVLPVDPLGVGVLAREGPDAVAGPEPPLPGAERLQIDEGGRPPIAPGLLGEAPAAEVVGAGNHAGADRLRHPDLVHERADLRRDL